MRRGPLRMPGRILGGSNTGTCARVLRSGRRKRAASGAPCVQLTPAAPCGGRVGVCGRESVAAFAIPLIAAAAAGVRVDVVVAARCSKSTRPPSAHWRACRRNGWRTSLPHRRRRVVAFSPPSDLLLPPCPWQRPGMVAEFGRTAGGVWGPGPCLRCCAPARSWVVDGRPTGPAYQAAPRFQLAAVAGPCCGAPPQRCGRACARCDASGASQWMGRGGPGNLRGTRLVCRASGGDVADRPWT